MAVIPVAFAPEPFVANVARIVVVVDPADDAA
jgi:hypothetical protein